VVRVAGRRIRTQADERSGDVEMPVERGLVEWRPSTGGVEIEADLDQEAYGIDAAEAHGGADEIGPGVGQLSGQGRIEAEQPIHTRTVDAHAGGPKLFDRCERLADGAGPFEQRGDVGVAVKHGELVGGASFAQGVVTADPVDVAHPIEQHADPLEAAALGGAA
jgi:hypothetical protein